MIINDDKIMMLVCSFCKRSQKYVKSILSSEYETCICNECIGTCVDIIRNKSFNLIFVHFIPHDIYVFLNKYVIGQERAKKILSVNVYRHYNRILRKFDKNYKQTEVSKSNILMIGPTGSGKTLLIHTLSKNLGVPIAMADATTMTEAGYVGEDVENILSRLLKSSNNDAGKAECGIIYIDEIDKISKKSEPNFGTRDVSGEGVQQGLLKLMEGTICFVNPLGARKNQQYVRINTKNILFVFSGAFSGLKNIIKSRTTASSLGFNNPKKRAYKIRLNYCDLIKYGMIPEFIGRISQIVLLNKLNINTIVKILNRPKNSLVKQYQKIFSYYGIAFIITNIAQVKASRISIEKGMGARGIKSIIENLLLDIMFIIPSQNNICKVIIDTII